MPELGRTISTTQVTCLGRVVNTENVSVSIPAEKLAVIKIYVKNGPINVSVQRWSSNHC